MADDIIQRLKDAKIPHAIIGKALGRKQPAATRLLNNQRSLKAHEIEPLERLYEKWTRGTQLEKAVLRISAQKTRPEGAEPDLPSITVEENSYVPVEVMPTYAGMGGGGTGEIDGEIETALVPRHLVEGVLRGHSEDFVVIRARGDSMEPDFKQDDEVLCDRRDRSPTQPGPFILWHDDGYVMKNIERVPDGRVRIFSSNPKYTTVEVPSETTRIIGRPVWVGRRL